jgi:hypothetical protein
MLQEKANHGILLMTYLPHASHIFQVPGVTLLGHFKSARKDLPPNQELDPQVDHHIRVFFADKIATTSMTRRGQWEKAGFGSVRRNDTCYLWVKENKIRSSPECQEVWQLDYPEAQLSQRRRE